MLLRILEEHTAHKLMMIGLAERPPMHNGESIKNDSDLPRTGYWIEDNPCGEEVCPPIGSVLAPRQAAPICSFCGKNSPCEKSPYCPHCGAEMENYT